jgi:sigma-B regulation protein RsbU (phosphoserine phosphatase)
VLLVEDNSDDVELFRLAMGRRHFELVVAGTLSEAQARVAEEGVDVVFLDLGLPDAKGLETFRLMKQSAPRLPIVVLTGHDDDGLGLATVREGAQDYLVKGQASGQLLARVVDYAVERKRLQEEMLMHTRALHRRQVQMERELQMASRVQKVLLTKRYPVLPAVTREGGALRFAHRYLPLGTVGGDFFHVWKISENEAGVFICDVMGHGVCAGLVTAMIRMSVGELASVADPGLMLARLNGSLRAVLQDPDLQMFASAVYMVVDVRRGVVRYANAGHPPPIHVQPELGAIHALKPARDACGPALGLVDGATYAPMERMLTEGDRLLLFTDGITEVEGEDGEPFGNSRLTEAVRNRPAASLDALVDGLIADVRSFSASRAFSDDLCLLAVEVLECGARAEAAREGLYVIPGARRADGYYEI